MITVFIVGLEGLVHVLSIGIGVKCRGVRLMGRVLDGGVGVLAGSLVYC